VTIFHRHEVREVQSFIDEWPCPVFPASSIEPDKPTMQGSGIEYFRRSSSIKRTPPSCNIDCRSEEGMMPELMMFV
jgi:hypothetical protein